MAQAGNCWRGMGDVTSCQRTNCAADSLGFPVRRDTGATAVGALAGVARPVQNPENWPAKAVFYRGLFPAQGTGA
jgi:hypothetical protein